MAKTLLKSGKLFTTTFGKRADTSGCDSSDCKQKKLLIMETKNQLIGRLLSSGKISSQEAITLLSDEEGVKVWGSKTWTPPAGEERGMLYDSPRYSPLPILPTLPPDVLQKTSEKTMNRPYTEEKINAAGKSCKCKSCKCGVNLG